MHICDFLAESQCQLPPRAILDEIESIQHATALMSALVNDSLEIGRLDCGKLNFNPQEVRLHSYNRVVWVPLHALGGGVCRFG
jgi:hypothetical protein